MKATGIKYIIKQIICWALLLQMIHVSIEPVNPLRFNEKGLSYHGTFSHYQADNILEWLYKAISHQAFSQRDMPVSESEESSFLEEFSVCLLWPFIDLEFIQSEHGKLFAAHFDHYLENFVPHYSEPNSPPPIGLNQTLV